MKNKIKFLLPTCLMAAASVATPLSLVSCSQDTYYTYDLSSETFTPSVEPYAPTVEEQTKLFDRNTATAKYIAEVEKNPKIFTDDLCYSYNQMIYSLPGFETTSVREFTVSITTPKFGWANVVYPGEKPIRYPTVSFKVKVDFKLDATGEVSSSNAKTKVTLSGSINNEYKDTIFYASPSNLTVQDAKPEKGKTVLANSWQVGCFVDGWQYAYMYNANPWFMDVNFKVNQTVETTNPITGETTTTTKGESFGEKLDTFIKLAKVASSASHGSDVESGYLWYALGFDFVSSFFQNLIVMPELTIGSLESNSRTPWVSTSSGGTTTFTGLDFHNHYVDGSGENDNMYITNIEKATSVITKLSIRLNDTVEIKIPYVNSQGKFDDSKAMTLYSSTTNPKYLYQYDPSVPVDAFQIAASNLSISDAEAKAMGEYYESLSLTEGKIAELRLNKTQWNVEYIYTIDSTQYHQPGIVLVNSPIVYWDVSPLLAG